MSTEIVTEPVVAVDQIGLISINPSDLLESGIPGGLDLSAFANDAFAQAIQLFDTVVSFNLPVVPLIRDFTEPLFA